MRKEWKLFITVILVPGLILAKYHHKFAEKRTHHKKTVVVQPTSDLKLNGAITTSYNYLQNSNQFTSGAFNRVYDIRGNGISVQQANITLAYLPKNGLGGLINPVIGRDSYIIAPYGWNPDFGNRTFGFAIPQAYLQYAKGPFTWMAGSFYSLAGAEIFNPITNTNFSRSILYGNAEPFTVSGLRASYLPNDKVSVYAGINNGWDSIRDTSRHKTVELGMSYVLNKIVTLATYGYFGQQRIADRTANGETGQRSLIDLVATLNLSDALSVVANYDYGTQSKAALPSGATARADWQGVAGYVNYKFDKKWRTSVRGEVFNDHDGYRTGIPQNWREATFTVGYAPNKNLELLAEARRDFSNQNAFIAKNDVDLRSNQQSIALAMVYKL